MIISLTQLLLGVVLLPFLWVAVDWLFSWMGDRRMRRRQRRLVRECHLCGIKYPEGRRVKISTCPACDAHNVRGGHRKLG